MKKIILFSAVVLWLLAILGCEKGKKHHTITSIAVVLYEGNPAVDGCGYFLKINEEKYKPIKLDSNFAINNLTVNVEYIILEKKWNCNWQQKKYSQINIIDISKK